MKFLLVTAAGLAALAGCSRETNMLRSLYSEAGSEIETRDFGNATMHNTMVQSGQKSQIINMTRKFAADVPNMVNFAFDSTVLDSEAQAALIRQADWIKQFPEVRFRVFGHTDLVGSDAYNKSLGLRRAQAVVRFLVSQGIDKSRLEAMVSYGETQPLVFTQDRERKNRRTVTEISGYIELNPLLLNGKYAAVIFREYVASAVPVHSQQEVTEGSASAGSSTGG